MSEIEGKPFEEEAELEATPVAEPAQEAEIQEVEIDANGGELQFADAAIRALHHDD